MTEAEKILEKVIDSPKYRAADYITDSVRELILDALNIALLLGDKASIDNFDVEIKHDVINFNEKSYYESSDFNFGEYQGLECECECKLGRFGGVIKTNECYPCKLKRQLKEASEKLDKALAK